MFKRVVNSNKSHGESHGTITSPIHKPKQGRERLRHFAEGISKAHEAIEDLEHRIARFESIITEAQVAQKSLQAAVHEDGGRSLSEFSSGKTAPDDKISKLVALAKASREAALAASDALPHTREALDNA
jgi:capsule polysaccharide export protein KpsE/RkpR